MWDFFPPVSSLSVCQRMVREITKSKGETEWALGREVSRDSIRAVLYVGMTASYTADREGD